MQRIANPCSSVRFRVAPPVNNNDKRKPTPRLTQHALRPRCLANRAGICRGIFFVLRHAFGQRSARPPVGIRPQPIRERARLAVLRLHPVLRRDANPSRYLA